MTYFCKWLKHEKGCGLDTMDDERLKGNGGGTYLKELLDRIRDIRSSEKFYIIKCLICMQQVLIMTCIARN